MPDNESKKEHVKEFLENPDNASMSNREIASLLGCHEGTVRRARTPDPATLRERIAALEAELKQFRRNLPPPRKQHSGPMTLFGEDE